MKYLEALRTLKYGRDTRFSLAGDEPYMKELFIENALGFMPHVEMMVFFPENEADALNFLSSGGLFGKRLAVLKDFDKMSMEKFERVLVDSSDIIFLSLTDKPRKSRALSSITSTTTIVECKKFREYGTEYPSWIASRASELGLMMEKGSEDVIYSMVGPDMFSLSHELDKLKLYSDGKALTIQDVKQVITRTSKGTLFDLLNHLMKKNIKEALCVIDTYRGLNDFYIDLVAFLGSYLEKIFRILSLKEKGLSPDEISDIVGIPVFLVRTRYMPGAITLGKAAVIRALNALCDLDVQLRLFKGDRRILIDRYLMSFSD